MNYIKILTSALSLAMLLSPISRGSESASSIDDYNKKFMACAKDSFPNGCVQKMFSGRLVPWMAHQDTVLGDMEKTWKRWLGERKVFAVHSEPAEISMQIFATQKYLIERDDGQIDGVWLIYRKLLGVWMLQEGQSGTSTEFIVDTVNLKSPRD